MRKAALLLTLLVLGCVSVGKSVLDSSFQSSPVPRDDVFVYLEADEIPEHTRIAILDAKGDTDWTDAGDLVNSLRKEAGKLGANAIILGDVEDVGTGAKIGKALLGTSANRKNRAIAIYVPSLDKRRN